MKQIKLSPYIQTYSHHDYLEPELKQLMQKGNNDMLDLTADPDEIKLFNIHNLVKPFLSSAVKESENIVKYFEEDPFYQETVGPVIQQYHHLPKSITNKQIFLGSGNYSLIKELVAFLLPQKLMIGNGPQFPEFPSYFTALGGSYKSFYNSTTWQFPTDEIIRELHTNSEVSVVFIDTPNNPTGIRAPHQELVAITEVAQEKGVVVIVDEAYGNYFVGKDTFAQEVPYFNNVIVTRSLSKGMDLGGIRFGYEIASQPLAEQIQKIHSPMEPSSFSVLFGKYILKHSNDVRKHFLQSKAAIRKYKKRTIDLFSNMGLHALPSDPDMPQLMFYKKGENLFKSFFDKKVIVRSGMMYQFTCPAMTDEYIRLRPPLTEKTFSQMVKMLT